MLDGYSRTEIEYLIEEYIVGMSHAKRNRDIMRSREIDGLTFEEIAEMYDLSTVQVKNIVYQCNAKLKGKTV